jgi:hypothetical protein
MPTHRNANPKRERAIEFSSKKIITSVRMAGNQGINMKRTPSKIKNKLMIKASKEYRK